uniref:Replication protein RepA n=1 Tax=Klebsiella pneumoniae TaxID=573 RepID=A0A2P1BPF7_KLEPN|nr:Replication protein RepA [Klebsiella pneumoniae]
MGGRKDDIMELTADESLWELYQFDRQVLLQMFIIRQLANKGTAQALYTFIESLPERPIPLSFARIKRRLMLTSPNNQQNRVINKAIDELKAVGYLDGDVVKRMVNGT